MGGAALPRVLGALSRPPWHDEYFTVWAAGLRLPDLLATLSLDSGPPLPYVLAKVLAPVAGSPLGGSRLVSVLAGVAAVAVLAGSGRGACRSRWWLAAVVVACHPLAVAWSCEGRAYSLLLLATALGLRGLHTLSLGGGGGVLLALAVTLACWSHSLGLVLAIALAAATYWLPAEPRRRALTGVAVGLAGWLPWLPVVLAQPGAAVEWMARAWDAMPLVSRWTAAVRLVPPGAPLDSAADLPGAAPLFQIFGIGALAALLARARSSMHWMLAGLPALGLWLAALATIPVFYPGRTEAIYLVPVAFLVATAGTGSWWRRGVLITCLVGWTVVTSLAVAAWRRAPAPPEKELARVTARALPQGGLVVAGGHWPLGVQFHLDQAGGRWLVVPFPAALARHPGWLDPSARPEPGELDSVFRAMAGAVSRGRAAVVVPAGLASTDDLHTLAVRLGLPPAGVILGTTLYLPDPGALLDDGAAVR